MGATECSSVTNVSEGLYPTACGLTTDFERRANGFTIALAMKTPRSQPHAQPPQPDVACSALTQPSLLSLIGSFQHGIPLVAKPLLLRFIGDGVVYCTNTRVRLAGDESVKVPYWYKTLPRWPRIVTPQYESVRPQRLWLDHVLPQAIAKYETPESYDVLAVWLRTSQAACQKKPRREYRKIVHRVSEAAALFGRVDLLQWLWERLGATAFTPPHQRRLVLLAARAGQANVFDWVEAVFSTAPVESCAKAIAFQALWRNHVDTLRWLVDRELVETSSLQLEIAINRNHPEILCYLLQVRPTAPGGLHNEYYRLAVLRGHHRILECLFERQRPYHVRWLVLLAVKLGHLDMAKFLLDIRGEMAPFFPDEVRGWIEGNKLEVLEMLASVVDSEALGCSVIRYTRCTSASHDSIRAMLRMSGADDVTKTLVWTALYNREAAELILATASALLPSDAEEFARRLMNEAVLGHDINKPSDYAWVMEGSELGAMEARLWSAEAREIRAIALYMIWQKPDGDELPALFEYDTRRQLSRVYLDDSFARLCVELAHTDKSRSCLENHLREQREALNYKFPIQY